MGLESATFITDLVDTNPVASDQRSQGDDHLRLLKTILRATFPNASRAFYFPDTQVKTSNFTIAASDQRKTFLVDTTLAEVTATLPTLLAADSGWSIGFIKTNTGTNPLFVAPASGTLQSGAYSGLAQARRCIPGVRTEALWTGTAWILSRAVNAPIGSLIDLQVADLPVGYEWPNGQTLASASTKYPEFYAANASSGVTLDLRGRVGAGKGNMGGADAARLTATHFGANGATLGAASSSESFQQTSATVGSHTHTTGVESQGHTHTYSVTLYGAATNSGIAFTVATSETSTNTGSQSANHTHAVNAGAAATPHSIVQPTIILNKALVVE